MLKKLISVTKKSFSNYSSEDELGKVNLFFGTNGSGKSSLAEWIFNQKKVNTRMFNSKYVYENIEVADQISGVKLTVGKQLIENKENIHRINRANENINNKLTQFEDEEKLLKDELFNIIDNQLKLAKIQFSINKKIMQKKNAHNDPVNALKSWEKNIDNDLKSENIGSSKELEAQLEIQRKNYETLAEINLMSDIEFQDLKSLLKKNVVEPNSKTSQTVVKWIREGLHVHNMEKNSNKTVCQFCNNEFDIETTKERINKRISTEHALLLEKLESYKRSLILSKKAAEGIKYRELDQEKKTFIDDLDYLIASIETKTKETENDISIDKVSLGKLQSFIDKILKARTLISSEINELRGMMTEIENVAKSWVGKQLSNNSRTNEIVTTLDKIGYSIEEYKNLHKENSKWIKEENDNNSDLMPFSRLVNNEFQKLGLDLELEVSKSGKNYILKHSKSQDVFSAKDLSEGERRLLAFLHFYYDMFDKPHESFSNEIEYIIIDDPITSLDTDNRYHLTSIINNFIKLVIETNLQLFIFTHSSMDYHNFAYAQKSSANVKYWKVFKETSGESQLSLVNNHDLTNFSDYYQSIFYSVMEFALKPNQSIESINSIHFGNKARLIFESHARSHYKIEYTTTTTSSLEKLKEVYEIDSEKEEAFKKMLDMINSLSHGFSINDYSVNSISSKEVQRAIRIMIGILYKKDSKHVEMLCGDLINKDNRGNIKNWY